MQSLEQVDSSSEIEVLEGKGSKAERNMKQRAEEAETSNLPGVSR